MLTSSAPRLKDTPVMPPAPPRRLHTIPSQHPNWSVVLCDYNGRRGIAIVHTNTVVLFLPLSLQQFRDLSSAAYDVACDNMTVADDIAAFLRGEA